MQSEAAERHLVVLVVEASGQVRSREADQIPEEELAYPIPVSIAHHSSVLP